jgi:putative ABC transport system permease protein
MSLHSDHKYPKWGVKLLKWWSKNAEIEDLLGDLEECYFDHISSKGKALAHLYYIRQVVSLLASYTLNKRRKDAKLKVYFTPTTISMIHNYTIVALRNFKRHKVFTTLNLVGLALGMSISLLAISVILAVFDLDEFHTKKDRIYQIGTIIKDDQGTRQYASTYNAMANYLASNYPFIESTVRVKSGFSPTVDHRGSEVPLDGYYADPSFLQVLDFPLLYGDPATALSKPNSIVLTQSAAALLFTIENPTGLLITTDQGDFQVTGVIVDPKQSHFYFQALTSFNTHTTANSSTPMEHDWQHFYRNYLFLMLKEGTSPTAMTSALQNAEKITAERNPELAISFVSVALTDLVPSWNVYHSLGLDWDLYGMLFFVGIGLLVLLPAVFNYINLSLARALKRAKEIGIRKVMGAEKFQIKMQFLVETILLSLLSLIGAVLIFMLIKDQFIDMMIGGETLNISLNVITVSSFAAFAIFIGVISGIIPAYYFAQLDPIVTLKGGSPKSGTSISMLKKSLFVFQFGLSLIFMIGVGAIVHTYSYALDYNHGFDSENILVVPLHGINKEVALQELATQPQVRSISTSSNLPGVMLPTALEVLPNATDTMSIGQVFIGSGFVENLQMELAWGTTGSEQQSSFNEEVVLVNRKFMEARRIFGDTPDSLVFKTSDGRNCKIVGILKNFNFEPLNEEIAPIVFRYSLEQSNYALLTLQPTDIRSTISDLDAIWTSIDQKVPFQSYFLKDEVEKAYQYIIIQFKIFVFLSLLAITISCLGLLGMVAFNTENRTKEIAIRKILGATNKSLYIVLSKEFLKIIIVAVMFAVPFSYFFYDKLFLPMLMKNSAGLGILEVIVGVVVLLSMGLTAIYFQTSKVANTNPANSLRTE